MRRAIGYVRISGKGQEDNYSFEYQSDAIKQYCEKLGLQLIDIVYEVHTGVDLDERKVITQIRLDMSKNKFDAIVVFKFDRLSREQVHQAIILHEAKKYGIDVLSTVDAENFDDSPLGNFMRSALGFVAAMEHSAIKLRMSEGRKKRIENGNLPGTPFPRFGYSWANDQKTAYKENPDQSGFVKEIFQLLAQGVSYRAIAREFSKRAIMTPGGKSTMWEINAVIRIATDSIYWGKPKANRYKTKVVKKIDPLTGNVRRVHTKEYLVGIDLPASVAPALVTEELAQRAHTQIETRKHLRISTSKYPEEYFLLRGFAYCEHCKHGLIACMHSNGYPMYRCNSRMRKPGSCYTTNAISGPKLEREVWQVILTIIQEPDILLQKVRDNVSLTPSSVKIIQDEIATLRAERESLINAIQKATSQTLIDSLVTRADSLEKPLEDWNEKLKDALEIELVRDDIEQNLTLLREWCERLQRNEELTFPQKRKLLSMLGIKVYVKKGTRHEKRVSIGVTPFAQPETVLICPPVSGSIGRSTSR